MSMSSSTCTTFPLKTCKKKTRKKNQNEQCLLWGERLSWRHTRWEKRCICQDHSKTSDSVKISDHWHHPQKLQSKRKSYAVCMSKYRTCKSAFIVQVQDMYTSDGSQKVFWRWINSHAHSASYPDVPCVCCYLRCSRRIIRTHPLQ